MPICRQVGRQLHRFSRERRPHQAADEEVQEQDRGESRYRRRVNPGENDRVLHVTRFNLRLETMICSVRRTRPGRGLLLESRL